jgi:hypothetical protein
MRKGGDFIELEVREIPIFGGDADESFDGCDINVLIVSMLIEFSNA